MINRNKNAIFARQNFSIYLLALDFLKDSINVNDAS